MVGGDVEGAQRKTEELARQPAELVVRQHDLTRCVCVCVRACVRACVLDLSPRSSLSWITLF